MPVLGLVWNSRAASPPAIPGAAQASVFLRHVKLADDKTRRLADAGWDFGAVPELFGRSAACDVVAKDMVLIHDGHVQTRYGRLYLAGVGDQFNLMGPEHARSIFRTDPHHVVDEVNRQLGGSLLDGIEALARYRILAFHASPSTFGPAASRPPRWAPSNRWWRGSNRCSRWPISGP